MFKIGSNEIQNGLKETKKSMKNLQKWIAKCAKKEQKLQCDNLKKLFMKELIVFQFCEIPANEKSGLVSFENEMYFLS